MIYVLDTNIIIRYLRDVSPVKQKIREAILQKQKLIIPRAVDYEICRGFRCTPAPRKYNNYADFAYKGYCSVVEICPQTWQKAEEVYTELYDKGFSVGEIDILIASFCLINNYILVTNNTKDFENIGGLSLLDWTQ